MSDENRENGISVDRDELDRFAQRLQRLRPVSSTPDVAQVMYRAGYHAAVEELSPNVTTHPPRRTWLAGPAGTIAAALLAVAAVAPIAYRQGVETASSEMRVAPNGVDGRSPQSGDPQSEDTPSHEVSNGGMPSGHDSTGSDETPQRSRGTQRSRNSGDSFGPVPGRLVDGANRRDFGGSRETEADPALAAFANSLVAWSKRFGGPSEWLGIDLDPKHEAMGLGEAIGLRDSSLRLIAARSASPWDGEGWPLPEDPALGPRRPRRSVPDRADGDAERETRGEPTLRANDRDRWGEWFDDPSLAGAAARTFRIR